MMKTFVNKRKDLSSEELMEIHSLCQLLPGASSTQTLCIIGYKKGGVALAVLTFILWILPACILMGGFSFLYANLHHHAIKPTMFQFLHSMAIGFLIYATYQAFVHHIKNTITRVIGLAALAGGYLFFHTPWVFPVLIILGGLATNFSKKRIPAKEKPSNHLRWTNIWLFLIVFVVAGYLSETARKENWENRKAFNLFENFYRFGSLVFGGGQVLIPMMYEQFVAREKMQYMQPEELMTGAGMVQAVPGPVFSVAAYAGGMVMREEGIGQQVLGCIIGAVAIFLPGLLLVLFFWPLWENLKKYVIIYRSLEGILAAVVGLMWAAVLCLSKDLFLQNTPAIDRVHFMVVVTTIYLLSLTKIPPPFIALFCLFLGWWF